MLLKGKVIAPSPLSNQFITLRSQRREFKYVFSDT